MFEVKKEIFQECAKSEEILFPCVLWILINKKILLLKKCVAVIDLPILQGFYVKQGDIYDNNYYT